jgi:hypothetical protein
LRLDDREACRSVTRRVFSAHPLGGEIEGVEELREPAGKIRRWSILGQDPHREASFGLPGRMAYIVSHACLLRHPDLAPKYRLTPSLDCVIFFAYA